MGFKIIIEALKIEKMPHVKRVRLSFVLLFILGATAFLLSPKDPPAAAFTQALEDFLVRQGRFPFPSDLLLLEMLKKILLEMVALYFILFYAVEYLISPHEELGAGPSGLVRLPAELAKTSSFRIAWRYYPYLLLLSAALFSLHLVSLPLYSIPYYVLVTMLSLTVFEIIFEKRTLLDGMEASRSLTHGLKWYIFLQFFVLNLVISMLANLLVTVTGANWWSSGLVRAFFYALVTLAYGRLAGMTYYSVKMVKLFPRPFPSNGL